MPPTDSKTTEVDARLAAQIKRRKHRRDTSGFLWGTWLMLFMAFALGDDARQGFRTGEWVDLSAEGGGILVPWWVAAVLSFAVLLFSGWCFGEYLKLKRTAPRYEPGDEDG